MRRVVVTGMGIISSIGNSLDEVTASLRAAKPGIVAAPDYAELGFRSQVKGDPQLDPFEILDRRVTRFMGKGAAWNYLAMQQAIADAGLEESDISNPMTGIVMGSGGASTRTIVEAADTTRKNTSPKRIGPLAVPKAMGSTASATLATPFGIKGINYTITAACATSKHCIGNAMEQIMLGKQDIVFAGGHEDLDWTLSDLFDAMGAMSSDFNATPEKASRCYDAARDGFVISGGAGVLVLEEYEHAKARGARIYAELAGYGVSCDAYHLTAPDPEGEGGARAIRLALQDAGVAPEEVQYYNAHGTSTPLNDPLETRMIKGAFGDHARKMKISSTKSMTGHLIAAAGGVEAIACTLAIRDGFYPPTINLDNQDIEGGCDLDYVPNTGVRGAIDVAVSGSLGFGGHNAVVVIRKYVA